MKLSEITNNPKRKYKSHKAWKILKYWDLLEEVDILVKQSKIVLSNNSDEKISSQLLYDIIITLEKIDSIPKNSFPKVFRNRLQRAYRDLLLKGNANLE